MESIDDLRRKLEETVQKVALSAPNFARQMNEIETIKIKANNLIDEETRLKDQISEEQSFVKHYDKTIGILEYNRNESQTRLNEAKSLLKEEIIKNAQIAIQNNETPLILQNIKCDGYSPLICSTRYKSQIIKEKAKIMKKIDTLHKLQRNAYCFDDDDENSNLPDLLLLNPEIDYSNFHTDKLSNIVQNQILQQKDANMISTVLNTISDLTNNFSQQINQKVEINNRISFDVLKLPQPNQLKPKDISNYCNKFAQLIELNLNDLIQKVDYQLCELKQIFFTDESKIQSATENFFRRNPQFKNSPSLLCTSEIFKAQECIVNAQHIIFLLNQAILPPDSKVYTEAHQIKVLLNELTSLFNRIHDRLSRDKIVGSEITIQSPKIEDFQIDEISHAQIERCSEIVDELKTIFKNNLDLQQTFLSNLNNLLATSRDTREMKSKIDMDLEILPPIEVDDSEERQKFLDLKARILKKQSEQLDTFREQLESLPDEILNIKPFIPLNVDESQNHDFNPNNNEMNQNENNDNHTNDQVNNEANPDNHENQEMNNLMNNNDTNLNNEIHQKNNEMIGSNQINYMNNNVSIENVDTNDVINNNEIEINERNQRRVNFPIKENDFIPIDLTLKMNYQKSNPFADSNKNLMEKVLKKNFTLFSARQISPEFPDFHQDDIFYQSHQKLANDLESSILTEKVEDLISQRDELLMILHNKEEELSNRARHQHEKAHKILVEKQKIQREKNRRESLLEKNTTQKETIERISSELPKIKEELPVLRKENNALTSKLMKLKSLKTKYEELEKQIQDVEEEGRKIDEECEAAENEILSRT